MLPDKGGAAYDSPLHRTNLFVVFSFNRMLTSNAPDGSEVNKIENGRQAEKDARADLFRKRFAKFQESKMRALNG